MYWKGNWVIRIVTSKFSYNVPPQAYYYLKHTNQAIFLGKGIHRGITMTVAKWRPYRMKTVIKTNESGLLHIISHRRERHLNDTLTETLVPRGKFKESILVQNLNFLEVRRRGREKKKIRGKQMLSRLRVWLKTIEWHRWNWNERRLNFDLCFVSMTLFNFMTLFFHYTIWQ